MTWYCFAGNNSQGHPIQGQCNTESELTLTSRLHAAGLTSVTLKKMHFLQVGWMRIKYFVSSLFPISKSNLSLFYYQLADMLEAGIPLKQALLVIANHLNNPRFVRIIHALIVSLSKGASFSEALSPYERLFSSAMIRLISLAKSKDELTAILRYCDQFVQRSTFSRKMFFMAMPQVSLMLVFCMVLLFLRFHYLESFNYAIFVFRNPVPPVIHVFNFITGLFSVHLLKTIGVIFGVIFGLKLLIRLSRYLRFFYSAILYYLPIISGVILAIERERLSLLYSVLLKGGASTQKCVQCSAAVVENLLFRRRVQEMSLAVERGDSLSNALRFFRIFNAAEVQMIVLGAVSNSLTKTFERIYSISQIILERRLLILLELTRLSFYILNTGLFCFVIYVAETLFYYPGPR